ncbi:MAG: hypothetical protein IKG36_00060 [Mycoplasmataceae bacterium]|nr:hypothetical protein [Mycoplasmataceae bacterium]
MINKTWKYVEKFFKNQTIINQWNNNKTINERWENYINIMLSQGLLWFVSKEILCFKDPYKFPEISIYKLKEELEKNSIFNIRKVLKKWKKLYKKSFNAIEILLKFGFIVNDSKYFNEIYNYNLLIFGSKKLSIEKTTVTFIDELDMHKLFKSKSYPPTTKYKDNSISLKEIKKNEKEVSKKYIKELKTKNNFIFNIKFVNKKNDEKNNYPFQKHLTFSIYFENKKIKKIQTIYEWNQFYESPKNDLDSFIESIKLIKKMFNLKKILHLLDEKWSSNHILNQKFSILKEELIKLEKSTNE